MNAIGIDVSKGKSMVAILRPLGECQRPAILSSRKHCILSIYVN